MGQVLTSKSYTPHQKKDFMTRNRESKLKDETQKQVLIVQVQSSGFDGANFAKITLNGLQVNVQKNESLHYRGLHLVIFNPENGLVHTATVFDTYETSEGLDMFIANIGRNLPDGFIVIAACQDDCVKAMTNTVVEWFEDMGSSRIRNLRYRCGFAFIGLIGKYEAIDKRAVTGPETV